MRVTRVSPPVCLVGSIVAMALLDHFVPVVDWIPWPWNLAGVAVIAAGGVLIRSSMSVLAREGTSAEPFQPANALATRGPFRFSRNPMYVGATAMLAGLAVVLGSVSPFLVLPLYIIAMQSGVIRPEEAALTQRFGDTYATYRASVRRWL